MPDSFFTKKRKRTINTVHPKRKEEELDSATDDDDHGNELDDVQRSDDNVSDDEDVNETPAEKRLRLAKLYVASLKEDIRTSVCFLFASSYSHYISLQKTVASMQQR
jgi:hypothetical protein